MSFINNRDTKRRQARIWRLLTAYNPLPSVGHMCVSHKVTSREYNACVVKDDVLIGQYITEIRARSLAEVPEASDSIAPTYFNARLLN